MTDAIVEAVAREYAELIERVAIRSAVANNGGEWATHYTVHQKNNWRKFAAELIADVTRFLQ